MTGSVLDRLFDAVGGDVSLSGIFEFDSLFYFDILLRFSGKPKDADDLINQVTEIASRFKKSDKYLFRSFDSLLELFENYKGGPAALARLVEVSKPRYGHIGINTDDKITTAIVEALQDERRTSLKTAWIRRERDRFNNQLQRKHVNDPKSMSKGEISRQLAKMTGSVETTYKRRLKSQDAIERWQSLETVPGEVFWTSATVDQVKGALATRAANKLAGGKALDRALRHSPSDVIQVLIDKGAVPKSDDAFIDLLLSVQTLPRDDKTAILRILRAAA